MSTHVRLRTKLGGPHRGTSTLPGSACRLAVIAPDPSRPVCHSSLTSVTTRPGTSHAPGPEPARRADARAVARLISRRRACRRVLPAVATWPPQLAGQPAEQVELLVRRDRRPVHQPVGQREERDDGADVPHVVLGQPVPAQARPGRSAVTAHRVDGEPDRHLQHRAQPRRQRRLAPVDGRPGRRGRGRGRGSGRWRRAPPRSRGSRWPRWWPPRSPRGRPWSAPAVSLSISASCSAKNARASAGRQASAAKTLGRKPLSSTAS